MICLLCKSISTRPFLEVDGKVYHHCADCDLRFLDPQFYLEADRERARYQQHENLVSDLGYQSYVNPMIQSILSRISPASEGLDYGCGEGPVISYLLERAGFTMFLYDPFFEPSSERLEREYDFVVVSEVAEHFHDPAMEFDRISRMIRANGFLSLMTKFFHKGVDFKNWHYRRDPTHVCFYSTQTIEWVAARFGFQSPEFSEDRVALLVKNTTK